MNRRRTGRRRRCCLDVDRLRPDAQQELAGFLHLPKIELHTLATARVSLLRLAAKGRFRADLAHELSTLTIALAVARQTSRGHSAFGAALSGSRPIRPTAGNCRGFQPARDGAAGPVAVERQSGRAGRGRSRSVPACDWTARDAGRLARLGPSGHRCVGPASRAMSSRSSSTSFWRTSKRSCSPGPCAQRAATSRRPRSCWA